MSGDGRVLLEGGREGVDRVVLKGDEDEDVDEGLLRVHGGEVGKALPVSKQGESDGEDGEGSNGNVLQEDNRGKDEGDEGPFKGCKGGGGGAGDET